MSTKAVLMSAKPEWCKKILSREKTVEVRKTRPKLETPFKVYIYCTKTAEGCGLFLFKAGSGWMDLLSANSPATR